MSASNISSATPSQISAMRPLRGGLDGVSSSTSAEDLRLHFTQFVGETFYGQMLKAMRATVGKPAYFHGGRGEEVFQGQLDQQMTQQLTEATASKFSEPLFERQFPHLAKKTPPNDLSQLSQLRRM